MRHHLAVEQPQSEKSLYPKLRIHRGDVVWVNNEECLADRRLGEKWILLNVGTGEPMVMSDTELMQLYGAGKLRWRSRTTKHQPLSPLAPQVMTEEAGCEALRKHNYVRYVTAHKDGFRASKPWIAARIAEKATEIGDENPPSPGSVLNWKKLHDAHYEAIGLAAYVRELALVQNLDDIQLGIELSQANVCQPP